MANPSPPTPPTDAPWWDALARRAWAPAALIIVLLILRLLWQWVSPYTLIEDEAHYWEWARRLDWSYYSKGPGVAWVIWASTRLLGDTEFAVRLPAAVATAIGAWGVAVTARDHFAHLPQSRQLTFLSALLYTCVPGLAVAGMIMTIDAPYIACWAWASAFALRALLLGKHHSWAWFGVFVVLGFIFKYTIVLLLPGVLLAAVLTRNHRPRVSPAWLIAGLLISLLGLLPVAIWNAHHDWATVRHLLGHLGAPGGDTEPTAAFRGWHWSPLWPLEYIATQTLIGGPVILLALFAWRNAAKHTDPPTRAATITALRAMIALALPILIFYLLVSLVTETEGNWAMAAFVTLVPPGAWGVYDGVTRRDHPVKFAWGAALVMGIAALLMFPGAHWIAQRPFVGRYMPLYRMTGMRDHAADAQRVLDQLRAQTGKEPLVMSEHYGRASQLAFYLPGHPVVYCTSAQVGGRKTQYDMWKQTDLSDPDTLAPLLGRPGLLFGGRPDQWSCAFTDLTDIGQLDAEPKDHRTTYTGLNFHTFASWTPPYTPDPSITPGEHPAP